MAGGPCTWSRSCICPCFSSPQAVSNFEEAGHSLSLVMSLLLGFQSAPAWCSRNQMAQPGVDMQSVVGAASVSSHRAVSDAVTLHSCLLNVRLSSLAIGPHEHWLLGGSIQFLSGSLCSLGHTLDGGVARLNINLCWTWLLRSDRPVMEQARSPRHSRSCKNHSARGMKGKVVL